MKNNSSQNFKDKSWSQSLRSPKAKTEAPSKICPKELEHKRRLEFYLIEKNRKRAASNLDFNSISSLTSARCTPKYINQDFRNIKTSQNSLTPRSCHTERDDTDLLNEKSKEYETVYEKLKMFYEDIIERQAADLAEIKAENFYLTNKLKAAESDFNKFDKELASSEVSTHLKSDEDNLNFFSNVAYYKTKIEEAEERMENQRSEFLEVITKLKAENLRLKNNA
ncbi:unnamed protein product [Blepharisma stoltei]|uniref:Uncharacterized protein n=1 Tax=Blepharisma stoltei TaxID=1481888 RepID=A0AAU9I932_9CILI|nr:unnamed protein product [Blepharisma stoltei]